MGASRLASMRVTWASMVWAMTPMVPRRANWRMARASAWSPRQPAARGQGRAEVLEQDDLGQLARVARWRSMIRLSE